MSFRLHTSARLGWARTGYVLVVLTLAGCALWAEPSAARISGKVLDPQGAPVAAAKVALLNAAGNTVRTVTTDDQGSYLIDQVDSGSYQLLASAPLFVSVVLNVGVTTGQQQAVNLQFQQIASSVQAVTVVASAPSVLTPDPSQSIVVHDEVLDANPGRPGAPISIPGLPIETASGGIKAPQYFSPGVAGDHGEPIAQFFQIGNFLFPNNLPANAHGNGYADPNVLIPPTIDSVSIDGAAFNVREGNNSIDLAAAYVPRPRFNSFRATHRRLPRRRHHGRLEPRQPQHQRLDRRRVLLRQRTSLIASSIASSTSSTDSASITSAVTTSLFSASATTAFPTFPDSSPSMSPSPTTPSTTASSTSPTTCSSSPTTNGSSASSANFRSPASIAITLSTLRSNFGDGLIQQSETRNVAGGEAMYIQSVRSWLAVMAGVDLRRDAPRNLDLNHIDDNGVFQPVTSNNLTMSFVEPFFSFDGTASRYLHFNLGVRQEAVWMDNQDLLNPQNSFNKLATLTLPKGTLTLLPPDRWYLPIVSFSAGEAFHTNDPRIGNGTGEPTLLAPSRAYQLVLSKVLKQTQFYVTLRRVSNSLELAKIDPDTGLQEAIGPSLNKVISVSLQRNFSYGSLYASYAQADARDRITGEPVPEAPRLIFDTVASANRLPFRLRARAEYEFVKAKPLGDGFTGVPVSEFRGAVLRPFLEDRASIAANFLIASGYTGQTTEVLALPTDPAPFERIVGVPLKSYLSLSLTYYFKH